MIDPEYGEWLARGQAHQAAGRAVDAMLCYRRALKVNRHAVLAQFHLGEVLLQLGLREDAIASWRSALTWQPKHLASLMALGDTLRLVAPVDAAEFYRRALAADAQLVAAQRGLAIALLAAADSQAFAQSPTVFTHATVTEWEEIARALARNETPAASGILEFATKGAPLAELPLLQALIVQSLAAGGPQDIERARAEIARLAADATPIADLEALRRFALAAAALGNATHCAERYAQRCASVYEMPVPVLWPQRTAGAALRVALLVAADRQMAAADNAIAVGDYLGALAPGLAKQGIAVAVFSVGGAAIDPRTMSALAGLPVAVIGDVADNAFARALGEADYDAMIDLAGMAVNTGPLLAARPARTLWTVTGVRARHAAPLIDAVLPALEGSDSTAWARHVDAIITALRGECMRAIGSSIALTADAMRQLWRGAVAAHQAGDADAAIAKYRDVISHQPDFAPARYLLGLLLRDRGEPALAEGELATAVRAAPRYADARSALANLMRDDNRADAAATLCSQGLDLSPASAVLWRSLGLAELARHDARAALDAFEHALDLAPVDAQTHYNLGVTLQTLHRRDEALRAYQRALAFEPENVAAEFNMGVVFQEEGRLDAAIHAFEQVIARDPRHVPAHKALGEALLAARRPGDWLKAFDRFQGNCPRAFPLAVQALEACQYRGDFATLDSYINRLRNDEFSPADETELADGLEQLLFLLLYFDIEPDAMLGFYRAYDAVVPRVYGTPLPLADERRPGRIRVGYLSGDLRNHVMGKMMWEAVRHHDRERFELFFFSLSAESDDVTQHYRELGDHFDVLADLSEQDAAHKIAQADLDLLVDLATNTRGAKPGIMALKPARVQITHVASAGVLGLGAVDFKLTDDYADLPENQAYQIETLLPMKGCVYPYRHTPAATQHPFHRQALGIPPDAIVMSAFVHPLKLSRRCLSLWREVLARLPRAVLAISPLSADMREVYGRLVTAGGISLQRILVLPQGRNDAENQARYNLVDFALDTLPYGGVNGTLEALDMGVPVVTLCGRRHGERTSYSILANLGVMQTVAMSGSDYVDIAVRLGTDPAFADEVRSAIKRGLAASALTDMQAHTRHLEQAYVDALRLRYPAALAVDTLAHA